MPSRTNKIIGCLLIIGAIALFIPYTFLTIIFEYPDILAVHFGYAGWY
jgi:hypothetical protein